MEKQLTEHNQLDLFAFDESITETKTDIIQDQPQDIISIFDNIEDSKNKETEKNNFRLYASVEVGDKVTVGHPIDQTPEAEGYFDYHKGKKGVVLKVTENRDPLNNNYQFYATILFANGEEGVFYDLELEISE